jgi:hypothetical protein
VAKLLTPDDFSDVRLKRIIKLAFERFQGGASPEDLLHLIHSEVLQQEDAAYLSELSLRGLGYDDPDRSGQDCIDFIKQKSRQRLKNSILRKIKEAEDQKNTVQVKILQTELMGLQKLQEKRIEAT